MANNGNRTSEQKQNPSQTNKNPNQAGQGREQDLDNTTQRDEDMRRKEGNR